MNHLGLEGKVALITGGSEGSITLNLKFKYKSSN